MSNRQTHYYDTSLVWAGRRRGLAAGPGLPGLPFSTPPEFNGDAGFWTPEHLFVLAAETCLMATFVAIAEMSKLQITAYASSAKGKLEWVEGEGYKFTEIQIQPCIDIENETDRGKVLRVLEKAEKGCLIARSMTVRISVLPEIKVLPRAKAS